ncbi:MAG: Sua5/YciO/YrdC/YwlC family protein [Gallionella sp.]|nr:Sua5/YciO/YrdC/YwlC family protein [Gallionella sp.]
MHRQDASYRAIASHLKRGGLIAYPTESCYGLGCDPNNYQAVRNLLKLKQRPQRKGLILIAANYQQVKNFIQPLNAKQQSILAEGGAQVTTYLMPALTSTQRCLRGMHHTLAIRLTAFQSAAQLCKGVRHALVSTSANRSGKRPAKTYSECRRLFGHQVWVLGGKVGVRKKPSAIRAWSDGKIIRS